MFQHCFEVCYGIDNEILHISDPYFLMAFQQRQIDVFLSD